MKVSPTELRPAQLRLAELEAVAQPLVLSVRSLTPIIGAISDRLLPTTGLISSSLDELDVQELSLIATSGRWHLHMRWGLTEDEMAQLLRQPARRVHVTTTSAGLRPVLLKGI